MNLRVHRIRGGVMATVIVICTLMMIFVLGVITVWDSELLLFGRLQFIRAQRDNLNSGFALYENHPEAFENGPLKLYDSIPSTITMEQKQWGLYKIVTITAVESRMKQIRMMGQRNTLDYCLYYPSRNGILNVSGSTHIEGKIRVPQNGVAYPQMNAEFFTGKEISPQQISHSRDSLMHTIGQAQVKKLLEYRRGEKMPLGEVENRFCDSAAIYVCNSNMLSLCWMKGHVILLADRLHIDPSSRLEDIIIVGNHITVGSGFRGSAQLFARDSLIVEESAELEYPSGVYCENHLELSENATIDGYVIVAALTKEKRGVLYHYKQAVSAKVRGMVYVNGIAQLQGLVNGVAILGRANYYAAQGRYNNQLHNATILESGLTAFPVWIEQQGTMQTIKWVE